MPASLPIPAALSNGPFTHQDALRCEVSEKVLRGRRFRRLHPRVWVLASYKMSDLDWIRAAELAMPDEARASHLTRLRRLGLDYGTFPPLHFTVQGELHLALDGIKLHRTKVMPPTDAQGVTPAAAFIGYAVEARVIDLIKVGDWLLYHEHTCPSVNCLRRPCATAGVRDQGRPFGSLATLTPVRDPSRNRKRVRYWCSLVFQGRRSMSTSSTAIASSLASTCSIGSGALSSSMKGVSMSPTYRNGTKTSRGMRVCAMRNGSTSRSPVSYT